MTTTVRSPAVAPHAGLVDWLAARGVEYELREHPLTFTALDTAVREGIDPGRFAKTLVVETDDERRALVVVDAWDRLDCGKAARVLHAEHCRLLDERELGAFAPDCDLGAVPAVGELFGVRVFADYAIHSAPEITFPAGSHAFTVTVDRAQWSVATRVVYGDLADDDDAPPWTSGEAR